MKAQEPKKKAQEVQLFHNHLIQMAITPDMYEDPDVVQITVRSRTAIRWDELALRRYAVR